MDTPWQPPAPAIVARNLILGLLGLVGLVAFLGFFLRGPIELVSSWFVSEFGLVGVFVGVFFMDILPVATHDPVLFAAHSGGVSFGPLCATAMVASILAAWFDFALGRMVGGRWLWLQTLFIRFQIPQFLNRYGAWAIGIAALLPMPFTLVAWASGMTGGRFQHLVVGSLLRACKVVLTVSLIRLGWEISA